MIGVLCVDDHPALRAGLLAVLRREPGIVPRGQVGSARLALESTRRDVDVVLADYRLPDIDGLALCVRLKQRRDPPRVLIYSAHGHAGLSLPARLAGADGMLDKRAPAEELLESIRRVARGEQVFPDAVTELADAETERLDPEDLPILSMIAGGSSRDDVGEILRIDAAELARRIDRMIAVLSPEPGIA